MFKNWMIIILVYLIFVKIIIFYVMLILVLFVIMICYFLVFGYKIRVSLKLFIGVLFLYSLGGENFRSWEFYLRVKFLLI